VICVLNFSHITFILLVKQQFVIIHRYIVYRWQKNPERTVIDPSFKHIRFLQKYK